MGISTEGRKEILGIWITENENASFWTSVCINLSNRGVRDILIACRNNLFGFSTAFKTVFPKTEQQLCIVNQIRKLHKHVLHEDLISMITDTKHIYSAPTLNEAGYMLEEFRRRWYIQYPQIVEFWDINWIELTTYFKYPEEVRRMIYTMNTIEGFHRIIRKFNKINTVYPTDDAVIKSVFLSIREINGKWSIPIKDWKIIIVQLTILFRGRIAA
jgi:putative transposase